MTDKDLLVIVSGLLQKQDQQAEILNQFMDISIKQFEVQQGYNERQEGFNERQEAFNKRQESFNESLLSSAERQQSFNEQQLSFAERQQSFNEQFLTKLDEISKKL